VGGVSKAGAAATGNPLSGCALRGIRVPLRAAGLWEGGEQGRGDEAESKKSASRGDIKPGARK
jgi:hypothetical protein